VEFASLAQSYTHPTSGLFSELYTRAKAKNLLDDLEAKLPVEIFNAAQERGKTLDLWKTVDEVLAEL